MRVLPGSSLDDVRIALRDLQMSADRTTPVDHVYLGWADAAVRRLRAFAPQDEIDRSYSPVSTGTQLRPGFPAM
jgi:hypothetical protein